MVKKSELSSTATEWTRAHYVRPEIRKVILDFCQDSNEWRALNGDDGWYIAAKEGNVRLRTPGDYDSTINKHRTLYATLDTFSADVKQVTKLWDNTQNRPAEPIGTFKDCLAYTLGADIDSLGDIINDPSVRDAVEDAARFLVQKLKDAGISKSIYSLFSGGGIYVFLHHELFRSKPEWIPEERERALRSLTGSYNMFLVDVETKFFQQHPEHRGKVKIDKINNQKRKFKCIFSIHKKHDLAVIPIDPNDIKINFDRARIPLSAEVLAEGAGWYKEFDVNEKEPLKTLLAPYAELVNEDLKRRQERTNNFEIYKQSEPLAIESWPPCMRNILGEVEPGKGPHRACAVLAAFLYHAGLDEEEALKIWKPVADRCGVEARIFDVWYGQMICPNCSTLQEVSSGYPRVGLGELGYCKPDELCNECKWPGNYGKCDETSIPSITEEEFNNIHIAENPCLEVRLEPDT